MFYHGGRLHSVLTAAVIFLLFFFLFCFSWGRMARPPRRLFENSSGVSIQINLLPHVFGKQKNCNGKNKGLALLVIKHDENDLHRVLSRRPFTSCFNGGRYFPTVFP